MHLSGSRSIGPIFVHDRPQNKPVPVLFDLSLVSGMLEIICFRFFLPPSWKLSPIKPCAHFLAPYILPVIHNWKCGLCFFLLVTFPPAPGMLKLCPAYHSSVLLPPSMTNPISGQDSPSAWEGLSLDILCSCSKCLFLSCLSGLC